MQVDDFAQKSSHKTRKHVESITKSSMEYYISTPEAMVLRAGGRRHYAPLKPSPVQRIPKYVSLAPKSGWEEKNRPEGVRKFDLPSQSEGEVIKKPYVRFPERYKTNTDEISLDKTLGNMRMLYGTDGQLISRQPSKELSLETAFGKKVRGYTVERSRNYIPSAKPGDLYYSQVERSDNYFHKEGNVPGSTIRPRKSRELIQPTKASGKKPPSYETLKRVQQLLSEMDEVSKLTQSQEGEASWEEKTGLQTWERKTAPNHEAE